MASRLGVAVAQPLISIEDVAADELAQDAAECAQLTPWRRPCASHEPLAIELLVRLEEQRDVGAVGVQMAVAGRPAQALEQLSTVCQEVRLGLPSGGLGRGAVAWFPHVPTIEASTPKTGPAR